MKNKKAVFQEMSGLGVGLAAFIIVMAVTFLVLSQVETQIGTVQGVNCTNDTQATTACNATIALATAADDIPGWVPLIVITVIGGLLIGLVAKFGGG